MKLIKSNLPIKMELDTGASLSLLNQQTYDKIANLQLQPTDVQTYTREVLQILGEAKVTCTVNYGEQTTISGICCQGKWAKSTGKRLAKQSQSLHR